MIPGGAIRAIVGLEIRSLLRDTRTLVLSVGLPLVLIPALLLISSWVEDRETERAETRTFTLAVTGPDSAFAVDLLSGALLNEEAPNDEDVGVASGDGSADQGPEGRARFRLVSVQDPVQALTADELDLHLETFHASEWEEAVARDTTDLETPEGYEGVRVFRVHYHAAHTASREGESLLREALEAQRETRRDSMALAAGFPVDPGEVARLEARNVAPEEVVQGARMGRFFTLILIGLVLLGGSALATDTLAGEKERGTLNTLLTSAASRTEIITGKLLAVMLVGFAIALIQVVNLWFFLGLGIVEAGAGFAVNVSLPMALGLLVLFLPVVALTSGVLLLTSAYARSYKEAQLYMTPVLLGMALPALAPLLPDISLQSAIVAVPLANLSVAVRDLLVGQLSLPWAVGAWGVTAGAAAWVTHRSVRALHDEGLITGDTSKAEFFGGDALFRKRILIWILALWAGKILLDVNMPFEDLRLVSLVSVGLVFGLFPFVVIRYFNLDPTEVLALRRPRPGVWLGVLIGVPAGLLLAGTLFQLMQFVIPVPQETLESFGQGLMPDHIPFWQLFIFLALVPGITEELTFRGVLLHGLRRRFGPVGLALAVGLIFGVFHFALFRIPTTAMLGVILTFVTLMTGSIFPAVVWHILNNGLAFYLGRSEIEFGGEGLGWALLGVGAMGLAFWIIWQNRTPYPDVGPLAKRREGTGG